MKHVNDILEGKNSRRKFLGATGSALIGLAGCTEPSGGSGSGVNGTDSPSGSGGNDSRTEESDSGSTGGTGNEPGEYPTQETTGGEAELDALADEDMLYSFKLENYDFLNIQEFPESERDDLTSYKKAIYFSTISEESGQETDEIYFLCDSREETKAITFFSVTEGEPFDPADGIYSTEDSSGTSQEEFFRDHIDPDGIVHAVDLDEHDYAVEALHSGFGSE